MQDLIGLYLASTYLAHQRREKQDADRHEGTRGKRSLLAAARGWAAGLAGRVTGRLQPLGADPRCCEGPCDR